MEKHLQVKYRCIYLRKITYTIKGKQSIFDSILGPFIHYLGRSNLAHVIDKPGAKPPQYSNLSKPFNLTFIMKLKYFTVI